MNLLTELKEIPDSWPTDQTKIGKFVSDIKPIFSVKQYEKWFTDYGKYPYKDEAGVAEFTVEKGNRFVTIPYEDARRELLSDRWKAWKDEYFSSDARRFKFHNFRLIEKNDIIDTQNFNENNYFFIGEGKFKFSEGGIFADDRTVDVYILPRKKDIQVIYNYIESKHKKTLKFHTYSYDLKSKSIVGDIIIPYAETIEQDTPRDIINKQRLNILFPESNRDEIDKLYDKIKKKSKETNTSVDWIISWQEKQQGKKIITPEFPPKEKSPDQERRVASTAKSTKDAYKAKPKIKPPINITTDNLDSYINRTVELLIQLGYNIDQQFTRDAAGFENINLRNQTIITEKLNIREAQELIDLLTSLQFVLESPLNLTPNQRRKITIIVNNWTSGKYGDLLAPYQNKLQVNPPVRWVPPAEEPPAEEPPAEEPPALKPGIRKSTAQAPEEPPAEEPPAEEKLTNIKVLNVIKDFPKDKFRHVTLETSLGKIIGTIEKNPPKNQSSLPFLYFLNPENKNEVLLYRQKANLSGWKFKWAGPPSELSPKRKKYLYTGSTSLGRTSQSVATQYKNYIPNLVKKWNEKNKRKLMLMTKRATSPESPAVVHKGNPLTFDDSEFEDTSNMSDADRQNLKKIRTLILNINRYNELVAKAQETTTIYASKNFSSVFGKLYDQLNEALTQKEKNEVLDIIDQLKTSASDPVFSDLNLGMLASVANAIVTNRWPLEQQELFNIKPQPKKTEPEQTTPKKTYGRFVDLPQTIAKNLGLRKLDNPKFIDRKTDPTGTIFYISSSSADRKIEKTVGSDLYPKDFNAIKSHLDSLNLEYGPSYEGPTQADTTPTSTDAQADAQADKTPATADAQAGTDYMKFGGFAERGEVQDFLKSLKSMEPTTRSREISRFLNSLKVLEYKDDKNGLIKIKRGLLYFLNNSKNIIGQADTSKIVEKYNSIADLLQKLGVASKQTSPEKVAAQQTQTQTSPADVPMGLAATPSQLATAFTSKDGERSWNLYKTTVMQNATSEDVLEKFGRQISAVMRKVPDEMKRKLAEFNRIFVGPELAKLRQASRAKTATQQNNSKQYKENTLNEQANMNISLNGDNSAEVAELLQLLRNAGMPNASTVASMHMSPEPAPPASSPCGETVEEEYDFEQPIKSFSDFTTRAKKALGFDMPFNILKKAFEIAMDQGFTASMKFLSDYHKSKGSNDKFGRDLPGKSSMEEDWDNSPDEEYNDDDYMVKDLSSGLNRKKDLGATRAKDPAIRTESVKKYQSQFKKALEEMYAAEADFDPYDPDVQELSARQEEINNAGYLRRLGKLIPNVNPDKILAIFNKLKAQSEKTGTPIESYIDYYEKNMAKKLSTRKNVDQAPGGKTSYQQQTTTFGKSSDVQSPIIKVPNGYKYKDRVYSTEQLAREAQRRGF